MSLKRLMLLTSSLATAGLAVSSLEAEAAGVNHAGTWGKPIDNSAGAGLPGLDCQVPQVAPVQRPQGVGPVAMPQMGGNGTFDNRNNGIATGASARSSSSPRRTTSVATWGWPTRSSSTATRASPT